jgi:CHASE2 domain-containing sensor protein
MAHRDPHKPRRWVRVRHVGFWKHYWRHGLRTVLFITGLMFLLEHQGCTHSWEMAGLDSFVRFNASRYSDDIVVVEITDDDYARQFQSRSPLDAERLGALLTAIHSAHPTLIVLDIDTSDPSFRKLGDLGVTAWSEVVWARVPKRLPRGEQPESNYQAELEPVAGGLVTEANHVGVPVFPVDSDGVVRRYRQQLETSAGRLPSLAWNAARRYNVKAKARSGDILFNFAGDRYAFPIVQAGEFLGPARPQEWSRILGGKIVIVGGDYAAGRDTYFTARGEMAGVELVAHAAQSDLQGGGIGEGSFLVSAALDIAFGTLLVLLFFRLHLGPALWISMFGLLPLALAGSWLSFRSLGYWVSFVPLMLGMLIHQLHDYATEQRDELEKLKKDREELLKLRRQLSDQEAPPPAV